MELKSLPVTLSSDVLEEEEFMPTGRFSFFHRRCWAQFPWYSKWKWSYWPIQARAGSCQSALPGQVISRQVYQVQRYRELGWQKLAAFRQRQKWPWKFPSNAYLLFSRQMRRFCALLQICKFKLVEYAIYYVIVRFLPKKHCFWAKKALFLPKDLQKVRKSRQILICGKIVYVRA